MSISILAWDLSKTLAHKIQNKTECQLIMPEIRTFPNGEKGVFIKSKPKNNKVVIVATFEENINTKIIEIMLVVDAIKRMGIEKIILLSPWLPYSPQDKIFRIGEPLSSHVLIKLFERIGVYKLLTCDLHSDNLKKKFKKKIDNIEMIHLFCDHIKTNFEKQLKNSLVAILDEGDTVRAQSFAKTLKLDTVKLHKSRNLENGEVFFHGLSGDVRNKNIFVYDDFVSTGATLIKSANYLKLKGALNYVCCVTHIICPDVIKRLENSLIDKFITTNTSCHMINSFGKFTLLDISSLLSQFVGSI